MIRHAVITVLASVVAAAGLHARPAPTNLLITASDGAHWSLVPSRTRLPAGTIHVELWNDGQDVHDVEVQRVNAAGEMTGPILASVHPTDPGDITHATWHLKVGRYELYCSMPGHFAMGMHSEITVTRA